MAGIKKCGFTRKTCLGAECVQFNISVGECVLTALAAIALAAGLVAMETPGWKRQKKEKENDGRNQR